MKENNIEIEEYKIGINEKNQKFIEKYNTEANKIIKVIFDDENETDVMNEVLNQLSKYYIKDILK